MNQRRVDLRYNKILIIMVVVLAGCSLTSHLVMLVTDINVSVIFGTITGLGSLIVLSSLACCWSSTITSLKIITKKLNDNKPEEAYAGAAKQLLPLLESIRKFSQDSAKKTEEITKQSMDFNLQLRLLRREKKNTESILYSINDAVIVIDGYDRLIMANSASERLFDFQFDELSVAPVSEVISDSKFISLMHQSGQSKQSHVKHDISVERGGEMLTFDCVISCVKDEAGEVSGVVAILHDITREKEISRMKNDFVSHVSHELKTPLASINAYAEMLVDGEAEDQATVVDFCKIIQSQAQRLNRLIEEILNISRIESGLIKVDKKPFSMAILIQESSKMIESYAKEKNISITVPAPIICDQVNADKDMVSQVVINLLSNAVKYTPKGGHITVESEVHEADKNICVKVSDTGVGIPADDVEHVFDKFFRVEANKKVAKGTGLGLNLVKQIVEKVHDGEVFVTSKVGEGSTFGFNMPLALEHAGKVSN
ncbi:MAG: PAS domain S-box protein [Planctomycetes bacterium]|nr:PAS domain S-box protein [Planctomycetota bacterium]